MAAPFDAPVVPWRSPALGRSPVPRGSSLPRMAELQSVDAAVVGDLCGDPFLHPGRRSDPVKLVIHGGS